MRDNTTMEDIAAEQYKNVLDQTTSTIPKALSMERLPGSTASRKRLTCSALNFSSRRKFYYSLLLWASADSHPRPAQSEYSASTRMYVLEMSDFLCLGIC